MVLSSQFCSFCENRFCHNLKTCKVKYIKVYNFRKGILQGIYLNHQILVKTVFLRNLQKRGVFFIFLFFKKFFITRVKPYFWTKNFKNLLKSSKYVYLGNVSSLFSLILYF